MLANRKKTLDYIFAHEGGYAERPEEGGGAVNMGVTFTTFKAWRKSEDVTWADLKAMTREEAEAIYTQKYLDKISFDKLPPGVDYFMLDSAIMSGVSGSSKFLQEALGHEPTGRLTKAHLWAANNRILVLLIHAFYEVRMTKYRDYKTYKKVAVKKTGKTWGQIWEERVKLVRDRALEMAEEYEPKGDA